MATYVETKILDALFARLAALTFSPVMPIAWPNSKFTPPADRKWLRVNEIPASATPFEMSGGTVDRIGLMQIDVFRPLNEGMKPGKEIAGKITDHFKPSSVPLYSEGVKVKITQASLGPALIDGDALQIPVTLRWRAFS